VFSCSNQCTLYAEVAALAHGHLRAPNYTLEINSNGLFQMDYCHTDVLVVGPKYTLAASQAAPGESR